MFIVDSYSTAIAFCIITMFCWGSWANTTKLTSKNWRFELFYWDYGVGILLTTLIIAFTLGSIGNEGRTFINDFNQADQSSLFSAFIGGVIFNIANILLVAAIAIAGISVAFPIGIGIALLLGVIVNYISQPQGDLFLIVGGVIFIVIAIILNAISYKQIGDKTGQTSSKNGIVISIISGCLMGLFYKYVSDSISPNFQNPQVGKLTPYTALVIFALGIVISNFLFNSLLMKYPFTGKPVSAKMYFRGGMKNHLIGIIGGVIWCIGMSFNILASEKASPAISYGLGQGATVVAAIWGIYIWKEFDGAKRKTNILLGLMMACYCLGLILLIISKL